MILLDIRSPIVIQSKAPPSTPNSLAIIEAAYDLESDDATWLVGLLRAVQPFIEKGLGVYGAMYETASDSSELYLDTPVFLDCPPGFPEILTVATEQLGGQYLRAITHFGPPCCSMSQAFEKLGPAAANPEPIQQVERQSGVAELLIVNSWQELGRGCCLVAPTDHQQRFPARTANVLARVARHISAARRLRQSVKRHEHGVSLEVEAVLGERGAVLHAEGEAKGKFERELLTNSARALLELKDRWRESDPEQVASTWNALVDGRWSLVDSFDRDGKRFLLARRNALELREPTSLSPGERQVAALFARGHSTRLVAYELGLSLSSVSSTLQRALRKLRLRSRTELVALFNPK